MFQKGRFYPFSKEKKLELLLPSLVFSAAILSTGFLARRNIAATITSCSGSDDDGEGGRERNDGGYKLSCITIKA